QVSHRDLKAPNVLMSGRDALSAQPMLIDLVGVQVGRPVPQRIRVRDLARLNISFIDCDRISRSDRLRLLRAYLVRTPTMPGNWKSWWRQIDLVSRAKVARNARAGRVLA